jgi:transcriptional regulator of acetoin/glycerol metabolism
MVELSVRYSASCDPIKAMISDRLWWKLLQLLRTAGEEVPAPDAPLNDVEAWHLRRSLRAHEGAVQATAESLGRSKKWFWDRRRRLGIG